MTLSANAEVDRKERDLCSIPVAASTTVYRGAIVGASSGYARGLNAGDAFLGIAYEKKDNSSGSAGDLDVRVWRRGRFLLTGSGFAQSDVGAKVYASADNTITKTSTSNSYIGRIAEYVSATQVYVDIDVLQDSI